MERRLKRLADEIRGRIEWAMVMRHMVRAHLWWKWRRQLNRPRAEQSGPGARELDADAEFNFVDPLSAEEGLS
jgi:hypothetical protein